MESYMSLMLSVAGVVISLTSVAFSVWVYNKYDKRIKEQEEKLNRFQLEEYKAKVEDSKKAILRADAFILDGRWCILVRNNGMSPARNIRILFDEDDKGGIEFATPSLLPYPILNMNDSFRLRLSTMIGHNIKPVIWMLWDDESSNDRFVEQSLCLS